MPRLCGQLRLVRLLELLLVLAVLDLHQAALLVEQLAKQGRRKPVSFLHLVRHDALLRLQVRSPPVLRRLTLCTATICRGRVREK